jgi:hypothetical protein
MSLTQKMNSERLYSPNTLFRLFLVYAFPFHFWYFIMAFRDFNWVAERTEIWDAIGMISYALAFALLETLGFFLLMLLLGLLVPRNWPKDKRVVLLGVSGLVVAIWAVLYQTYYLAGAPIPGILADYLLNASHPLRILWLGSAFIVFVSISTPVLMIIKSDRFNRILIDVFDRVTLISAVYLLFDFAGLAVILFRNLRV